MVLSKSSSSEKREVLGALVIGRGSRTWGRPLKGKTEMELALSALVQRG